MLAFVNVEGLTIGTKKCSGRSGSVHFCCVANYTLLEIETSLSRDRDPVFSANQYLI
jgi:hypothetical protein